MKLLIASGFISLLARDCRLHVLGSSHPKYIPALTSLLDFDLLIFTPSSFNSPVCTKTGCCHPRMSHMNFSISLSIISSLPLKTWVMPKRWSSIAHESSSIGQTIYFFPTLGCSLPEILNKTLSRKAGFGCFISVFILRIASPSLYFPASIFFHSLKFSSAAAFLWLHSLPSSLFFLNCSAGQKHTYALSFFISSS